jgi:hypothetical protein
MQLHQCQLAHTTSLYQNVHPSLVGLFARLSPMPEPPREVLQGHSRF